MFKRFLVIMSLCLMLVSPAFAQDALTNTLMSDDGLSVKYPDGYIAEADSDLSIALIDLEQGVFIVIGVGNAVVDFTGDDPQSSADAKDNFISMLESLGGGLGDEPVEEFTINESPAFIIPFADQFIGSGYVITFELVDGTVMGGMLFGSEETEFTPEMVANLKAIAESTRYDPSQAVVDEEEVEPVEEAETEEIEETDPNIPVDAILIEDMPEGFILTNTGLQMPYPAGFVFPPDTDYVENTIGMFSSDFQNTLIIFSDTLDNLGGLDTIAQFILPTLASIGGQEDFEADEHLQTLEVDGRTITYYDSTDFVEDSDVGGVYYFIIELMPDSADVALVQATIGVGNVEEVEPIIYEFVQQITLTEEATIEAEMMSEIDELATVECATPSFDIITSENPTATVSCPSDCSLAGNVIWGTEIYTDDSSICTAAIHMGVIDDMGGEVVVTYLDGLSEYTSTTLNGITSEAYGEWGASFSVSAPEEE